MAAFSGTASTFLCHPISTNYQMWWGFMSNKDTPIILSCHQDKVQTFLWRPNSLLCRLTLAPILAGHPALAPSPLTGPSLFRGACLAAGMRPLQGRCRSKVWGEVMGSKRRLKTRRDRTRGLRLWRSSHVWEVGPSEGQTWLCMASGGCGMKDQGAQDPGECACPSQGCSTNGGPHTLLRVLLPVPVPILPLP